MDQFEVDLEENDHIGGIDRLLIGFGIASMALLPTLFYSIFKPAKLAPFLDGVTKPSDRRGGVIGPGIYFVMSIVFFVVIFIWTGSVNTEKSTPANISENNVGYEAGKEIGQGMKALTDSLRDNLADGNIWSAIAISFPIYLFAVYLGFMGALIFWAVSPKWTAKESIGAGLYVFGGWICVLALATGIASLTPSAMLGGVAISSLVFLQTILVGWQYYALVKHQTQALDEKIIPRAILMPFVLVAGLVLVIMSIP